MTTGQLEIPAAMEKAKKARGHLMKVMLAVMGKAHLIMETVKMMT